MAYGFQLLNSLSISFKWHIRTEFKIFNQWKLISKLSTVQYNI